MRTTKSTIPNLARPVKAQIQSGDYPNADELIENALSAALLIEGEAAEKCKRLLAGEIERVQLPSGVVARCMPAQE